MPLGYHINPDDGLITVQGDGSVAVGEITQLVQSLLADGRFDPTLPQIMDFRGLRPVQAQPDQPGAAIAALREFLQQEYRRRVRADIAVVIDEHLERRHCADIYLLTCTMEAAELFADYDQALRWLMRRAFASPWPRGADEAAPARPAAASGEHDDAPGDGAHGAPE
ncbi:MAG: hypothetical protein CMD39_06570 [Gammaproteobacteria bacterium]|nr:hypothetical protein [Gammaproteobacteria bacterium]